MVKRQVNYKQLVEKIHAKYLSEKQLNINLINKLKDAEDKINILQNTHICRNCKNSNINITDKRKTKSISSSDKIFNNLLIGYYNYEKNIFT